MNDTRPPVVRFVSASGGRISLAITDAGSGVDPSTISVTIDGTVAVSHYSNGLLVVPASAGHHELAVTVSAYQEVKNMEDVGPIEPNTATFKRTVTVT
jgi:hypothetical protein